MSLARFEQHLRDPAPGFRCFDCGDDREQLNHLAKVRNQVGRPATPQALAILEDRLGEAARHLRPFYELHDGVVLYKDPRSSTAGIDFFRTRDWERRTCDMREWALMGDEYEKMPDWFRRGVVFAGIRHSATYFAIQTHGRSAGAIYCFDHDDFKRRPLARSFDAFLAKILRNPARFLYDCGCYTRYADGWIPKEYVADCRAP